MVPTRVPEAEVVLPGGLVMESGRCLTRAKLRQLIGIEEEWLAEARALPSAMKATHILTSCLISLDGEMVDAARVRRLLVGDRDFLLMELRRLTLGDEVAAVIRCPVCDKPMDIDFRLSEIPVERRPQKTLWYTGDDGSRFRLPNGGDQEAVVGLAPEAAEQEMLRRCVEGPGNGAAEQMERLAPRVELDLDMICPECSHEFVSPFDITAFFFDELRSKGGQLLREVHTLAFYYHWSEAEILSLGRKRRHAYLNLLNESLRQE